MSIPDTIEAILFHYAEPVKVARLATLLKITEGEVRDALGELDARLSEKGGVRLVQNRDEVTLGTAPEASATIEAITKEELSKELSKSAVETLSIVLYKGPLTRAEIDYIRGVNSTFILRNLQIRGLVEKIDNPNDQRSFLYQPTFRLLESLGVKRLADLPRYDEVATTLASFVTTKEEEAKEEGPQLPENTDAVPSPQPSPPKGEGAEASNDDESSTDYRLQTSDLSDDEADIAEENEAGNGYDDEELREHHETGELSDDSESMI